MRRHPADPLHRGASSTCKKALRTFNLLVLVRASFIVDVDLFGVVGLCHFAELFIRCLASAHHETLHTNKSRKSSRPAMLICHHIVHQTTTTETIYKILECPRKTTDFYCTTSHNTCVHFLIRQRIPRISLTKPHQDSVSSQQRFHVFQNIQAPKGEENIRHSYI